jgi:hypothetical protein
MPKAGDCESMRIFHTNSAFLQITMSSVSRSRILPNVKDEPRPSLARLVQHHNLDSAVSFQKDVP